MNGLRMTCMIILVGLLVACTSTPTASPTIADTAVASPPTSTSPVVATPTATPLSPEEQVLQKADAAVQALRAEDMAALAALVHPEMGVRFSPYSYILPNHLTFLPSQLPTLLEDPRIYTWGNYDGSGEPIELAFRQYYERFIYDRDFSNPERRALNEIIQQGNTLINIDEAYPGAFFVEYNFSLGIDPASPSKEMEWKSLRLIFLPLGETWYLVGIVHDQWTI